MQTEPIGFKGTTGIWEVDHGGISASESKEYGNIIAEAPMLWEESMKFWEHNSKFICASKKMAIALQPFHELAKECLKNTNLDKDQTIFAYNNAVINMQDLRNVVEALTSAGLLSD